MKAYHVANYISIFGFLATILTNSFLIFLSLFHIKHIFGTYKNLIIIFSLLGILFSAWDVIIHPSVHNYNGAFMYFSLNTMFPNWILSFCIACYSGFYSLILAFIAVQFLYRYFSLTGSLWLKTFHGWDAVIWICFVMIPCAMFVIFDTVLMAPDEFADDYMRWEIYQIYEREIESLPRFVMVPWDGDDVRWKNMSFIFAISSVMALELLIIVHCAFRMAAELKRQMSILSERNRRLESQFFKALLAQTAFPTLLLALPTGPILLLPLFDLKISLQSGLLYSLFSLYPSIDSVAMMLIITEYRHCAGKVWRSCKKQPNNVTVQSINATVSCTLV